MDPPPSLPSTSVPTPAASAAAPPPVDPPDECDAFHGFRVMPRNELSVMPFQPNSGSVVLPRKTAPASRNRATLGESSVTGSADDVREPDRVGRPATSRLS